MSPASTTPPPSITLTGVDQHTTITTLIEIADAAIATVEYGFLYSANPDGRPRYPEREWLARILPRFPFPTALHVCGSAARKQLLSNGLLDLTSSVRRIQVNGVLTREDVEAICALYPKKSIITQHTEANDDLLKVRARNHQLLVDGSGGRGECPRAWVRPTTKKGVGFAGGLNPLNIPEHLPAIRACARGPSLWIDMESGIRTTDDLFDVVAAHAAVEALDAAVAAAHETGGKRRAAS